MRVHLWMVLLILSVGSCVFLAEAQSKGLPPFSRIVSRQGWPGQPDVIGRKHISKGAHLKCIDVLHYPKQTDDGAACVLRFEKDNRQALPFGQELQAPTEGDVYLECAGDKPTRCTVAAW